MIRVLCVRVGVDLKFRYRGLLILSVIMRMRLKASRGAVDEVVRAVSFAGHIGVSAGGLRKLGSILGSS